MFLNNLDFYSSSDKSNPKLIREHCIDVIKKFSWNAMEIWCSADFNKALLWTFMKFSELLTPRKWRTDEVFNTSTSFRQKPSIIFSRKIHYDSEFSRILCPLCLSLWEHFCIFVFFFLLTWWNCYKKACIMETFWNNGCP